MLLIVRDGVIKYNFQDVTDSSELVVNSEGTFTRKELYEDDSITTTSHTCAASGCYKSGTISIIGFSGEYEYYCAEHYQDMKDILDYLLGD